MKLTIMLILLLIVSNMSATNDITDNKPTIPDMFLLNFNVGYEHNLNSLSNINTTMKIKYSPNTWLTNTTGFKVRTNNNYGFTTDFNLKYWLDTNHDDKISINNQYLYNISINNNLHDFAIILYGEYSHRYVDVGIGVYSRMFTPINIEPNIKRTTIWEPGIVYNLEARIFPYKHSWNIAAQITNRRSFELERMYQPNFILKGNYRINGYGNDNLNLIVSTGMQPAGLLHITVTYYSFFFNIGISCLL